MSLSQTTMEVCGSWTIRQAVHTISTNTSCSLGSTHFCILKNTEPCQAMLDATSSKELRKRFLSMKTFLQWQKKKSRTSIQRLTRKISIITQSKSAHCASTALVNASIMIFADLTLEDLEVMLVEFGQE